MFHVKHLISGEARSDAVNKKGAPKAPSSGSGIG